MAEAVAKSVKETTNDFVTSVQETDWKSELSVFGKTVHQETVDLGVKTVRAVEALPEVMHRNPPFQRIAYLVFEG